MDSAVLFELKQTKKRLSYYNQLKEKAGENPPASVLKWIQIYSERSQDLQSQAERLGINLSEDLSSDQLRNKQKDH